MYSVLILRVVIEHLTPDLEGLEHDIELFNDPMTETPMCFCGPKHRNRSNSAFSSSTLPCLCKRPANGRVQNAALRSTSMKVATTRSNPPIRCLGAVTEG